jgi:tol-pal system protein YbgF
MMCAKSRFLAVAMLAACFASPASAQDAAELSVRLDRLENVIRQLTGTVEQLTFRNQQLETQLKRLQDDNEFRFQQLGSKGAAAPPQQQMVPQPNPLPAVPGRRSDVFDPSQNPTAPGAPRTLGSGTPMASQAQSAAPEPADNLPPVGAPGGRPAGAPLDLSTLSRNAPDDPPPQPGINSQPAPRNATLAAVPPAGGPSAVAPPSDQPKDIYDLGYGYVKRKDYALAEGTFRDFLKQHPNDRLAPDAQFWLGETMFQRQRYRDAADVFLVVVSNHEKSGKAPDALLRLGQSLAALGQKEMACASLSEVGRKYPRASASVKRGVEQEQKRAHC